MRPAHHTRPKRKRSLKRKVIVLVSGFVATTMVVVTVVVAILLDGYLSHQMQNTLKDVGYSVQMLLEQRIAYLVENTERLTENQLVINGLLDPQGRQTYLPKLSENFAQGRDVLAFSLVDFDGRPIYQNGSELPDYNSSRELRTALAMGQLTLFIRPPENHLVVAAPVEFYETAQGAVVVEFDLEAISQRNRLNHPTAYYKLFHGNREILSRNFSAEEHYIGERVTADGASPMLRRLQLQLEIGLPETVYRAPVWEAVQHFVFLGALLTIAAVFMSAWIANTIARPILTLYRRVTAKEPTEGLENALGTGDELEELAHGFALRTAELKEQQQRLERMAHFDALTQLPNRVLLADRMQQALARAERSGALLAICYLDLDGFKPINDRYGHGFGDMLLVEVAARLRQAVRGTDTVARLGGDEFVLLLADLRYQSECEHTLDRLLKSVAQPYPLGAGLNVEVSASVGVTLFPMDDSDSDTLLRHADQAMYLAKQNGRNQYHLFDPDHDRQIRTHREALFRLEQALAREEFVLHYQPKINMRDGTVIGAEALIRWQHPERGLLPPGEFLPLIENTDLVVSVDEWVLRRALSDLGGWLGQGLDLSVSVNIAGRHLQRRDFRAGLEALLAQHRQIPRGALELEILETTALADLQQVSKLIEACQELGISFALDDFGTGYSSLGYLKQLPAEVLKINKSFVCDMLDDREDLAIVEGIIGLTRAFGRRVIAEGVETVEHGVMLLQLGCDLGQGFGIAEPMPPAQIPEWVRHYRVDPLWQETERVVWSHEDLPLITAEFEHQHWFQELEAYLDADPGEAGPPPDAENCRFGHWLAQTGEEQYRVRYGFPALVALHTEIHALANELLRLREKGERDRIGERRGELVRLRNRLVKQLRNLRTKPASRAGSVQAR